MMGLSVTDWVIVGVLLMVAAYIRYPGVKRAVRATGRMFAQGLLLWGQAMTGQVKDDDGDDDWRRSSR